MSELYFYGDGSLPGAEHRGHFTHLPERNGGPPRCEYGLPPAELNDQRCNSFFPWVPFAWDDEAQRSIGHHVGEGQGMGVARYSRQGRYTVLAMWDRTGDRRGNCVAMFYIPEHITRAEMLERIQRDYPRLWARICRRAPMAICGTSDPDPEVVAVLPTPAAAPAVTGIALDDAAPGLWERVMGEDVSLRETDAPVAGAANVATLNRQGKR